MTRNAGRLLMLVVSVLAGAWGARTLEAPVGIGAAAGALVGVLAVLLELGAGRSPGSRTSTGSHAGSSMPRRAVGTTRFWTPR